MASQRSRSQPTWAQLDLFSSGAAGVQAPKPRATRRWLMRAVDHGHEDVGCGRPWLAHLVCPRCQHDAGWLRFATSSASNRGLPCPACERAGTSGRDAALRT